MAKHWSLAGIWNQAFEDIQDEPIKKRDYLYASELGNSYIEVYYKLKGTPYTNTFTVVNRRKMEMGKLCEGVVRFVLKRAGILKKSQHVADHQLPGLLSVHGRLDFLAGGVVDVKQAESCRDLIKYMFEELEFPRIYLTVAENTLKMVKKLAGKKNEPLHEYVYELKSVSDFVFRMIESATRPLNDHHLQIYHYLLAGGIDKGVVGYLSREDGRLFERPVDKGREIDLQYRSWIEQMSVYAVGKQPPPTEPLILWQRDTCTFNKNTRGVEWCKYLTKIYGYESGDAFRDHIVPMVKDMNYVLDRCVSCATLTAHNHERINEARKLFPDWDSLVDMAKLRKVKKEKQL